MVRMANRWKMISTRSSDTPTRAEKYFRSAQSAPQRKGINQEKWQRQRMGRLPISKVSPTQKGPSQENHHIGALEAAELIAIGIDDLFLSIPTFRTKDQNMEKEARETEKGRMDELTLRIGTMLMEKLNMRMLGNNLTPTTMIMEWNCIEMIQRHRPINAPDYTQYPNRSMGRKLSIRPIRGGSIIPIRSIDGIIRYRKPATARFHIKNNYRSKTTKGILLFFLVPAHLEPRWCKNGCRAGVLV